MRRTPVRLAQAAAAVQADLRRTTGRPWTCTVDTSLVLTVSDGTKAEAVLLDDEVDDVDYLLPAGASAAQVEEALVEDAAEVVSDEVLEIMRALGEGLPVCPEHDRPLGLCSGVWLCSGPPAHDVLVGTLGRPRV